MNTPAHLIFGLTAFGRAQSRRTTAAALAGSMLPDLSLYLLAGTHIFLLGTDPQTVFGQLYFSSTWQSIFQIDNSLVLWGIALVLGIMSRSTVTIAFCGAALLHLAGDFALHHDDGRAHFWPLTDWIFSSPVSYWDPNHYGNIFSLIEITAVLTCCVVLWRRYPGRWMRGLITVLAFAQLAPAIAFRLMSAG